MPLPAHYNDPAIIERSEPLDENDEYWSTRALFVHGIKMPKQFEQACGCGGTGPHAHRTHTARTPHAHRIRTACVRHAHGMRTACARHAHRMHTACAPHAHHMCTACVRHTHGMRTACTLYMQAKQRWNLSRPDAALNVRCFPADEMPSGVNKHYGNWQWARVPCPPGQGVAVGDFCSVSPRDHFSFCSFPWVIPPEVRAAALSRRGAVATPLQRRRKGKGKGKGRGKGKGNRGRLTRAHKAAMDTMDV